MIRLACGSAVNSAVNSPLKKHTVKRSAIASIAHAIDPK